LTPTNLIIGALGLLTAVVCALCVGYLLRVHLDAVGPSASYHKQIRFPDAPSAKGEKRS